MAVRLRGREQADGAPGVPRRSGQEGRRLEHERREPAIAELDEECQRLLELRRRRLGVTALGVDLGGVPAFAFEQLRHDGGDGYRHRHAG